MRGKAERTSCVLAGLHDGAIFDSFRGGPFKSCQKVTGMLCGTPFRMAKERDLRLRTMAFAIAVSEFCETLPDNYKGRHVGGQLFRAGTAVAANYRAACRGRSKPDFIAKLGTVIEESDETDFWLEFAAASQLVKAGLEQKLRVESNELTAIFTQSQITARRNLGR